MSSVCCRPIPATPRWCSGTKQSATTTTRRPDPSQGPSLGLPIQVGEKGTLSLPLVGELPVEGLTVSQATEKIRLAYRDKDILNNEKSERVLISLIKPRVTRVLVVRSDTELDAPQFLDTRRVEYSKRGYAQTLDLPPSENDVMHALTATDGLPGTDAKNEVWVIRAGAVGAESMLARLKATDNPESLIQEPTFGPHCIRIPLSVLPGEPVCFTPDDVILHPGDIVYVPPRNEYFFTGGLLNGAKIPLPRDEDVDIIEAIAMAQGSVGGPLATSGQNSLRFSNKPGYVIPPSRAIVIRKLPNGQQLPIRVDLGRALRDPRERLVIQPDDLVTVQYTASELAANIAINIVNVNFIFSPDR